MKIDTSNWHEFTVPEIFETQKIGSKAQVPTGANVPTRYLQDGDLPRVTASNFNNGIIGKYSSDDKNYKIYENFISVSFLGTVFYQPTKVSLDMKVHCLKPLHHELNKYTALYVVSVIRDVISKFTYADQLSSTSITELAFKLPAIQQASGEYEPNWEYMENYMKNVESSCHIELENLLATPEEKHLVDVNEWKDFHLYDDYMFDIHSGTKMDKSKMTEVNPTINFVGRANQNNGITMIVDEIDGIKPFDAGKMTLSLGGEYLGSCFVQPKPFYVSQNVVVLTPKVKMSNYIKWYIATAIFKESRLHYKAFSDELNRHIMTDFSFKLPITSTGEPNWQYMENYMRNIETTMQSKIECTIF